MPIQIVPPHPSTLIEPPTVMAPGGQMTDRGGPKLPRVELIQVYLGDWSTAGNEVATLTQFGKDVVASPYLSDLAEYSGVGPGTFVKECFLGWDGTPPPPPKPGGCLGIPGTLRNRLAPKASVAPSSIDDVQIAQMLNAAIAAGALPPKTSQTLYMTLVQAGVTVTLNSQNAASCREFCGYHNDDGKGLYYGVLPHPDCLGCVGTIVDPFQALTSIFSHELAEAVTDPVPGTGWYNDQSGEIGDPCAWKTKNLTVGGRTYTVQLEWLNSRGGCA